jgi:hypothetical protein
MSTTSHIIALLIEERSKIEAAIEALRRDTASGLPSGKTAEDESMPDWVKSMPKSSTPMPAAPMRKKISAAARRRMAEGQRKRYAAIRAAKAETAAPKVSKKLADIVAPPEDAEFKSKMSIAMAKSWAKRRAAATKKKA